MEAIQKPITNYSQDFVKECLEKLNEACSLSANESYQLMDDILQGKLSPIQLSAILTSFRLNEIDAQEISGLSQAMLDHAVKIRYYRNDPIIDIVGTGGAKFKSFNVSTTSSLVMPLLDVGVAKHGNRTTTAKSGSADLLEKLGVNIQMEPTVAEKCLNKLNLTFMFAPSYHPAMKNVVPIRKELQVKTIFNLLGPLVNPACVKRQITGIFSPDLLLPIINCFKFRDFEHVAVFYNDLGADEIIQIGNTTVYELNQGKIEKYVLTAQDFGVNTCSIIDVHNRNPLDAANLVIETLSGNHSSVSDFIAINMAMALRIAEKEEDLKIGTQMALEALESGKAIDILRDFVKLSGGDEEKFHSILKE